MEIEIITKRDLAVFKTELLNELMQIMKNSSIEPEKEYLRSREVRKLLGGISNGTLCNLRVKGLLKPTKIEGVFYYRLSEIKALLREGTDLQ